MKMTLTEIRLASLTTAVAMAWMAPAKAQLFNSTSPGSQATSAPFSGGSGVTVGGRSMSGAITPNSRFVRGGRQPTDFVGSDSGDRRAFVGSQQTRGRRARTPATTPLPSRPEPTVNQAQPQAESNSSTSMYPPRLVLDDELMAIQPTGVASSLQRQ